MINLFYEEAYWGSAKTLSGPKKVIDNLKASLEQENIPYVINEEKYKNNLLSQYDYTGHLKHSKLTLETCVIGPQIWHLDEHVNTLKQNPHYYKTIITPSQWVKDLYVNKCGFSEDKVSVWPVGITLPEYKSFISVELVIVVAAIATALLPLYTTKLLLAVNSWPCTFVR